MKNELLRLENISYSLEGTGSFNNVSLRVFENEVLCILGLNNSGKSFLANYLSGTLCANSGKVFYMESPVIPANQLSAISNDIFLINMNTRPPTNTTFSEYLYILSGRQAPFFYSKKSTSRIAKTLLSSMNINIDPERSIDSYSISKQHILMILGAYFNKKKIIIIDCITDGYSSKDINLLKYTIEQVKITGVAIVFFTHKYDVAKVFSEKVALMKKGKIVKIIEPLDFYDKHTIYSSLSEKNDFNFCRKHIVDKSLNITISNIIPNHDISSHKGEIVGIFDNTNLIATKLTKLLDDNR